MANPFENDEASYFVLVNDEGQHSLWPAFAELPEGWRKAHGEDTRAACLAYVEENWTDMRPLSLVRAMAGDAA
ncbi:MbtH family protein [Streptomyces sp. NBC_01016]|uniref:MbtH family protein n=1 Tax=Streptomyces sp. NBC_01016 TaxID=2903720 RepID=UPI002256C2D4|nr:MbtH family protein [Streptomyces sp. NBC_01016]MCX4830331.1 MbtH family protein [Streptomyces sp. NBC_01016]